MATSTLLAGGGEARRSIGTVSAAEFAVTLAISITFLFSIGLEHWRVIAGLLVGGVIAAPLAALLVRHVRERVVLFAVGGLVMLISVVQIYRALPG